MDEAKKQGVGESGTKGSAAERLEIFASLLQRLDARGMAGAPSPALGESRLDAAKRFESEFRAMRFEGGDDLFKMLERAPNLVSDWFYGSPCAAVGLMRAGFSPMRFEELRHQNNCFNRTSRTSPEYAEIMMSALAQGWNPDTASDGDRPGYSSHPITRAIWAWGDEAEDDKAVQIYRDVIVALVGASPRYDMDLAWMAIRDMDMASTRDEIKRFMDSVFRVRDERSELGECVGASMSLKAKKPSL